MTVWKNAGTMGDGLSVSSAFIGLCTSQKRRGSQYFCVYAVDIAVTIV